MARMPNEVFIYSNDEMSEVTQFPEHGGFATFDVGSHNAQVRFFFDSLEHVKSFASDLLAKAEEAGKEAA